jgi:5-methyltetrahydropteroyltriglutamate--homocysteine methyltransferase
MVISANLGCSRIGRKRELKKSLEGYWAGKIGKNELIEAGRKIRFENWSLQKEIGIQQIPCNDFSFYDHMLDMAVLLGTIPARFINVARPFDLDTYFAMARGSDIGLFRGIPPLEMTKWFNTNYHYLVPEISPDMTFKKNTIKITGEFEESKSLGVTTRPVLIGPVSFLLLSKSSSEELTPISKINELLPVYSSILQELFEKGADWVQMDEPCLVRDLDAETRAAYQIAFNQLGKLANRPKIQLTTYFDTLRENLSIAASSPFEAIHLDLCRDRQSIISTLQDIPKEKTISFGLVNGRNVWKANPVEIVEIVQNAIKALPRDQIIISPSCSLIHVPQDLDQELTMDEVVKATLAFGKQKLQEVVQITEWLNAKSLPGKMNKIDHADVSIKKGDPLVQERLRKISHTTMTRKSSFKERKAIQYKIYSLPLLPTTTIGSFPQTSMVRNARKRFTAGELDRLEYEDFIKKEIARTIKFQEEIGIDVLVHGEYERNDMVQYFAEQMDGFEFTENGWVQSFGSRYVRPPIIHGDIARPKPMTVDWSRYAQSQSKKPVKGMLTGPVTILNWSFVREDQPIADTCRQIALAIKDEVNDLEMAGIGIIQIDEPALREGLPLHKKDRNEYLTWAVDCFKICTGGVRDETQIHTHMCYSEFNDIIESIAAMDADVISIEAARSHMELLKAFSDFHYPNDIGPGVYDIHSPHIPGQAEVYELLKEAVNVLPTDQIWVNPDCGLKTRSWDEVEPALKALVAATRQLRNEIQSSKK